MNGNIYLDKRKIERMDALYITTRKILPLNTGAALYSYGILQYLKELDINVTYASFHEGEPYTAEEVEFLKKTCVEVETVELKFANTALNFSREYPNNVRKYIRKDMMDLMDKLSRRCDYKLLVVDHVHMFEYAKCFPNAKVVLIEHNIEANLWKEYAERSKGLVKSLVARSAEMLDDYERMAIRRADGVISIADTDAKVFERYTENPEKICIMHPYNLYDRVKSEEDVSNTSNSICFIGGYNWYPNQAAADYLVNELMPILRQKRPGIKLYLVGKEPTETMRGYAAEYSDVVVTGIVDSVDPYIEHCDIFVNAMFDGSGMNIKMMEAMGKGIPVVTSEYGCRGIPVTDGKEVLVFQSPEQCAEQICSLLEDKAAALQMTQTAREFYRKFIEPDEKVRDTFLKPKNSY